MQRSPSDLLQAFAYFAHVQGEAERVEEITKNTFTFGAGGLWSLLALRPLGATKENFLDFWDTYLQEHPLEDRHAADAQNSHRLFNEEIARWSPARST